MRKDLSRNGGFRFYPLVHGGVRQRETAREAKAKPGKSIRTDGTVLAESTADVLAPQAKRHQLATSPSHAGVGSIDPVGYSPPSILVELFHHLQGSLRPRRESG